jgi:hypothetical protein
MYPNLDPEQHMVIGAPASHYARRYTEALAAITATLGREPATLDEAEAADPARWAVMVEALTALAPVTGLLPDDDMQRRAGLVPVDQAVMGQ